MSTRHPSRTTATLSAALSTVLLLALILTVGPPAEAAKTSATRAALDGVRHRITLITGDVVTVTGVGDGRSTVTIDRASDSTGAIRTQTVGHDLYVLPDAEFPAPKGPGFTVRYSVQRIGGVLQRRPVADDAAGLQRAAQDEGR